MVSIVILSYNTEDLLKTCLSSIFKNIYSTELEVIVVDNASKDGSVEMIKKNFKKVVLIENKENVGFAKGVNIGAKKAKGDLLLFLNSDTQINTDIVDIFIEILKKDSKIAVVSGVLENQKGQIEPSFGKFITPLSLFFNHKELSVPLSNIEIDWVNGACFFIKKEVFEKLGGFDEHFFMYVEDMELCYRIKQAGYKIVLTPSVRILHMGQGSSDRSFAIMHIYKGILYFFKKHKNTVEYMVVKLFLITKAYFAIGIGVILGKPALVNTYKKALQTI